MMVLQDRLQGPVVSWLNDRPHDWEEWETIIREKVGSATRVILVSNGRGQWRVSDADLPPVFVGPGSRAETASIDCREAVKAALRAAGKPILD